MTWGIILTMVAIFFGLAAAGVLVMKVDRIIGGDGPP